MGPRSDLQHYENWFTYNKEWGGWMYVLQDSMYGECECQEIVTRKKNKRNMADQ